MFHAIDSVTRSLTGEFVPSLSLTDTFGAFDRYCVSKLWCLIAVKGAFEKQSFPDYLQDSGPDYRLIVETLLSVKAKMF